MSTIKIVYTCRQCGLELVACDVRERKADEDVAVWLREIVTPALRDDHDKRSPVCMASKISELRIPIMGVSYVGQAVTH